MKISVILIVTVVASSVSGFDTDYQDTPFFDSLPRSLSSRFISKFSDDSYSSPPPTYSEDPTNYGGDEGPEFHTKGRIYYESSLPSQFSHLSHRPKPSFYKDSTASSFKFFDEYRGPPPPMLSEDQRIQTSAVRDERPLGAEKLYATTASDLEQRFKEAEVTKQPLSFGGHSNHLSFGNHALGFASVAAVTSADINPLAVAEITSTTRAATAAAPTSTTSISMPPPPIPASPNQVQVSQQQLATNPPTSTTKMPLSVSPALKIIQSESSSSTRTSNNQESTTPSVTRTPTGTSSIAPKSNLDSTQKALNQSPSVTMILHELPRTTHEFRTVTQELPALSHGQLPIEALQQQLQQQHGQQQHHHHQQLHVPDVKQNFLIYETKTNFPSQQSDYQAQLQHQLQQHLQQQQQNNNNIAPLRFNIPTGSIDVTKIASFQGLDLSRTPLASLTSVPNSISYTQGQQLDTSLLNKIQSVNSAANIPSFYFSQNNDQAAKSMVQPNGGIPLGSFYLIPNNAQGINQDQVKQIFQASPMETQGSQLSQRAFGGIEFLMSSSNLEPAKQQNTEALKAGLNLQQQFQSSEPMYTKIGFGQNPW